MKEKLMVLEEVLQFWNDLENEWDDGNQNKVTDWTQGNNQTDLMDNTFIRIEIPLMVDWESNLDIDDEIHSLMNP